MNKTILINTGAAVLALGSVLAAGVQHHRVTQARHALAAQPTREDTDRQTEQVSAVQTNLHQAQLDVAALEQKLKGTKKDVAENAYAITKKREQYNNNEKKRSAKNEELAKAERDLKAAQKRYDDAVAAKAKAEAEKKAAAEKAAAEEEARRKAEAAKKDSAKSKTKTKRRR
ncbi:MAG: hypothetical protein ACI4OS_05065 [Akkermansia sp.]